MPRHPEGQLESCADDLESAAVDLLPSDRRKPVWYSRARAPHSHQRFGMRPRCALLNICVGADPLVANIAQQYMTDREGHDKIAAEWTKKYAT